MVVQKENRPIFLFFHHKNKVQLRNCKEHSISHNYHHTDHNLCNETRRIKYLITALRASQLETGFRNKSSVLWCTCSRRETTEQRHDHTTARVRAVLYSNWNGINGFLIRSNEVNCIYFRFNFVYVTYEDAQKGERLRRSCGLKHPEYQNLQYSEIIKMTFY